MADDLRQTLAGRAAEEAARQWTDTSDETIDGADGAAGATTLSGLVPLVRSRLAIPRSVSDATVETALRAITACTDVRGRWMAAFSSDLGGWLAADGRDLNTTLRVLIAIAPAPRF